MQDEVWKHLYGKSSDDLLDCSFVILDRHTRHLGDGEQNAEPVELHAQCCSLSVFKEEKVIAVDLEMDEKRLALRFVNVSKRLIKAFKSVEAGAMLKIQGYPSRLKDQFVLSCTYLAMEDHLLDAPANTVSALPASENDNSGSVDGEEKSAGDEPVAHAVNSPFSPDTESVEAAETDRLTADLALWENDVRILQALGHELVHRVQRCMAHMPSQSETELTEWEAKVKRLESFCASLAKYI